MLVVFVVVCTEDYKNVIVCPQQGLDSDTPSAFSCLCWYGDDDKDGDNDNDDIDGGDLFFFFCVPTYISEVHLFWRDFCVCDRFRFF